MSRYILDTHIIEQYDGYRKDIASLRNARALTPLANDEALWLDIDHREGALQSAFVNGWKRGRKALTQEDNDEPA